MTMTEFFDDMKQFIDARFAQQDTYIEELIDRKLEEKLEVKLEAKFEEKLAPIRHDIKELTDFVIEAFDSINNIHDKDHKNHERRICALERRAA